MNHLAATAYVELARVSSEILTRAGSGSGGGRSSGGGSSGGSSGGFSSGSSGFSSGGAGGALSAIVALIFGGICLFVIVVIVIFFVRKGGGVASAGSSAAGLPSNLGQTNTMLGDPNQAQITTRADIDAGIAQIQQHDPAFNESDFLSDANRGFFVIQQAWTERKPEISRQVMHDGVWQQHKFQIDQYIQQNKQNVLETLAVQNIRVVAAHTDATYDTIVVRYFASCADYDIDLSNDKHKVIRGSKNIEDWAEDWVYQRSSKAVTKPNATMKAKCPNCGAPLDLDLAGICKYCGAPVMSGEFDWVLTRIEQLPNYEWAQQTLPQ
ncbi:MAG: zinc-ribbon domain-containing transport protein [Actinobacteria bacterium]|nr:zinc-ribbon domain-containing transport protein [Actinomycetota bacterium]